MVALSEYKKRSFNYQVLSGLKYQHYIHYPRARVRTARMFVLTCFFALSCSGVRARMRACEKFQKYLILLSKLQFKSALMLLFLKVSASLIYRVSYITN